MRRADNDIYDLERFIAAQADTYDRVIEELKAGAKTSHWMWFIFPQYQGLGHSPTAQHFAIRSLDEARAYLKHPVLGARLIACTEWVIAVENRTAHDIFGFTDTLKFRSSMTLFDQVDEVSGVFKKALAKYFNTEPDNATLMLIGRA